MIESSGTTSLVFLLCLHHLYESQNLLKIHYSVVLSCSMVASLQVDEVKLNTDKMWSFFFIKIKIFKCFISPFLFSFGLLLFYHII